MTTICSRFRNGLKIKTKWSPHANLIRGIAASSSPETADTADKSCRCHLVGILITVRRLHTQSLLTYERSKMKTGELRIHYIITDSKNNEILEKAFKALLSIWDYEYSFSRYSSKSGKCKMFFYNKKIT